MTGNVITPPCITGNSYHWQQLLSCESPPLIVSPPYLQAFMSTSRSQSHFSAGPLHPELASSLSLSDKCRIRDRSTIMARHMFADQGDRFADMQVNRGGA